ncbi:MAG: hypothetical protein ACE5E7_15625 [Anaerolineae bacterium]
MYVLLPDVGHIGLLTTAKIEPVLAKTIELHFDQIEPLSQLFQEYGVQVRTVRDLLESR